MSISRRMLLASAGMAPIAAHANSGEAQAKHADVIIVGAGAAGIEAARLLSAAGISVVILEASSVIGGRMKPGRLAEETIDLGAQWVGPGQNRFYARAQALGVETKAQSTLGENIAFLSDRSFHNVGGETMSSEDLAEFYSVIERFTQLAGRIDPANPWHTDDAAQLDNESVARWMDQWIKSTITHALITSIIRIVCCVEPSQISMLGWARYMAAAGGFLPLIDTEGGAQQDTFIGGAYQVIERNSRSIEHNIILNTPVSKITQNSAGVVIETTTETWTAKRVIVTAPPSIAARIAYDPPLPAARDTLGQRMPMGSVIKCLIAFDRPFWRDMGFSGQVTTDGDFVGFFEKSLTKSSHGALVGFFAGVRADYWAKQSPTDRRQHIIKTVGAAFETNPPDPIDYVDYVWKNNPWIRGGYTGIPMPDTLAAVGDMLAQPIGNIHWAGTETSSEWTGYVEGALASAERAVSEVLASLNH